MVTKFDATFESLYSAPCPEWFRDAKLGIWSHWGPQSVPMYGDWYARNMYIEGTPQNIYHVRTYGHPSKFGYKDVCALWKAENFNPDALMELYYKAGARYFVSQAMHHDHFFNYPSKLNLMNSSLVGPKMDICGMWQKAASRYSLPFGLTEHLGASFSWWRVNKGSDEYGPYKGIPYDGNDPQWRDFYFDNYEHGLYDKIQASPWYTSNENFRAYWVNVMKEIIDMFTPDLLYSDGTLPFGKHWHSDDELENNPDFNPGLEVVACLYNSSIDKYSENRAVYTQKDRQPEVYKVGIQDVEKSQLPDINPLPWQTDTCIGNWFYDVRQEYKRPGHIIELLVDIISKNGTMLLNILQKPDGTIDDEANWILKEMAGWYNVCGEAVFGTRPWRSFGEGASGVLIDGFTENAVNWTESDYRFTAKSGKLYVFIMNPPASGVCVIKSLSDGERVRNVRLLGGGYLKWAFNYGILTVKLPEKLPTIYTNCLEIELS